MSLVMSFFEDHGDVEAELESIYKFRKEVQHVEREYLELRILLRDAESALRADPANGEMLVRVHHYKRRLEDLENQYPWISSGYSREIGLWAPPAG
ncbi:MAG: hypothetical protein JSU80_02925 [Deltaproteobacteria bacterium]|nr:MAG: hypothetical protein JSU80_02925 [Deltaproteobacteria bacterium]